MIRKEPSSRTGYIRVTFEIPASLWADRVYLVGDFNHWNPCASPLQRMHDGVWRITLELPEYRQYEFRYLIDGRWSTDYHADGCAKGNGKGNNSLLITTLPLESMATATGTSMVREAAYDKGVDLAAKRDYVMTNHA